MAKAARWFTVLILCCRWLSAAAALPVPEDSVVLRNSGELYYLSEGSERLTLAQLLSQAEPWQPANTATQLPRASDKPVWFRFQIAAPANDRQLILFHPIPRQITLDVYVVRNGEVTASYETGSSRPFASRPLPYSSYLFPIALDAHESLDIYMRVRGYPGMALEFLQLWPEQKLLTVLPAHNGFEWASIGVMLAATLVSCVVWFFVRGRIFGLFVLFVAAQLLGYFISRGYAAQWLWPNSPGLEVIANALLIPVSLCINLGFAIAFLNVREQAPQLYRVSQILLFAMAALALFAPFWPISVEKIGLAGILILYPVVLGISFYLFRYGNNRTDAGAFLLCWTVYTVALIVSLIMSLTGTNYWYTQHFIDVAQLLRILSFAACLGYRYQQTLRSEESARADARAKSEFLARMSHEIRTPMNGILGMSELLRDAGLNNIQRRYNDIVYSSATALLTVINDILDFSKIQAGRMSVEKIPFDLHRVAVDALTLFRLKADEKNVELLCDVTLNVPAWVVGDPTRIRQILINFLSNAIKFTDAGEIRLKLSRREDFIRISVEDTGPGIPADVQLHLFESFTQADVSIARHHGGTGLGLAITTQLAELMGGRVGVRSQLSQGSTFWVELPLPATVKQEEALPVFALQDKSILIVDDNIHFCEMVVEHVKSWGMQLQIAHSGDAALARVRELRKENTNFDLISIDFKMPGMNGLELAQALKADCGASLPPLLLLTATTDIPQSATLRNAGIVLMQEKPLLARDLRIAFARALGLAAPPVPIIAAPATRIEIPGYALIVLVVEDNPTNRIVIQSMLQKLGHGCLLAVDGVEAIAMYESRHADFDLILMDCEMPGVSGYEATRHIRAYEREQHLARKTIVALTAHTLEEHIQLCHEAGMDGHLAKPLGVEQLREFLADLNNSIAHYQHGI